MEGSVCPDGQSTSGGREAIGEFTDWISLLTKQFQIYSYCLYKMHCLRAHIVCIYMVHLTTSVPECLILVAGEPVEASSRNAIEL